MVRAGEIVADGFWRMMTEENRTGIADGQKQIFSRHAGKLKMLRRERVDKGRRFAGKVRNENDRSVILPAFRGNGAARHRCELIHDGGSRRLSNTLVIGNENCLGCFIML